MPSNPDKKGRNFDDKPTLPIQSDFGALDATQAFEGAASDASVSREIGPYQLLKQIGEGGMGTVWLARQTEPIRRHVALKLIRAGISDSRVIARFDAERQAVAMMSHENIATVFDAGTSDEGTPYFVMELVEGVPITDYCDQNKLSLRQRLELFIPVCRAVQHAHQKGIVHRDLKPHNILVSNADGRPVVKVIDFGLAKALERERKLTPAAVTEMGQVVGTIQYMSPEQASMDSLDIDTRTDIYALGVVLYQLLVGSTPIDVDTIRKHAFLQILEIIRSKDPPRPSDRLGSSVGNVESISEQRQIQPAQLRRILRGDLDWIVMKSIEKDRIRRYETAESLAKDIGRFIDGGTVEARPPSAQYVVKKFVRRNRTPLTIVSVVAASIIGVVGASWYAAEAEATRRRQEAVNEVRLREAAETALYESEKSLERSNRLLANVKFSDNRVAEALALLDDIPPKLRRLEWYANRRIFCGSDITLEHGGARVDQFDLVPNSRKLVSISSASSLLNPEAGGEFRLWDTLSGQVIKRVSLKTTPSHVTCSGSAAFVAFENGQVVRFSLEDLRALGTFQFHDGPVSCLILSPDGKTIASAGRQDKSLRLWNSQSCEPIAKVDVESPVLAAAFAPLADWLVTSRGRELTVWELSTFKRVQSLPDQDNTVGSLTFNTDGRQLASGDSGGTIVLWNAENWTQNRILEGEHSGPVSSVSFSPDGRSLATGSWDHTVKIWDLEKEQVVHDLYGHQALVQSVLFADGGNRVVSASSDGSIKIWDALTGMPFRGIQATSKAVRCVKFSHDGRRIATVDSEAQITIWDLISGARLKDMPESGAPGSPIEFSRKGEFLASCTLDGIINLSNVDNGELIQQCVGLGVPAESIAVDPLGELIAASSGRVGVKVWYVKTGELVSEIGDAKSPGGTFVAYSPDGDFLATSAAMQSVELRDRTGANVLRSFPIRRLEMNMEIAFTADGSSLAVASNVLGRGSEVVLHNCQDSEAPKTIAKNAAIVTGISIAHSGSRITTSSNDGAVRVWNADTGEELIAFGKNKFQNPIRGADETVAAQFNPTGGNFPALAIADGRRVILIDGQLSQEEEHLFRVFKGGANEKLQDVQTAESRNATN